MMLVDCQLDRIAHRGLARLKLILKLCRMPWARKAAYLWAGWLVRNGAHASAGRKPDITEEGWVAFVS